MENRIRKNRSRDCYDRTNMTTSNMTSSARHNFIIVSMRTSLLLMFFWICICPVPTEAVEIDVTVPNAIVIGGDRDYPPYEFLDKDGKPTGYNVELSRAIADVMGMQVEFRFGGWSEMRGALMKGTVDALQGISYSDDRTKTLSFSPPIRSSPMPSLPGRRRRRSVLSKSCAAKRS